MAHLAKDEHMVEAFNKGADIHRETAAKIHGKAPEDVTDEERSAAKAINFGIIYGMGPQRLARDQGISNAEAKAFIDKYFFNYSGIQAFIEESKSTARDCGYSTTFFGRTRPIPNILSANPMEMRASENIAVNSPIQGTAADIMKLGMLAVAKALKEQKLKSQMLLQVHDELLFEGPISEKEALAALLKECLENVVSFSVPLLVDVGHGSSWLEAK